MADSFQTKRATENGSLSIASADLPSTIASSECSPSRDGPSTTSNPVARMESVQPNDPSKSSLSFSSNEADSKESDREEREADDKIGNESIDTPHRIQNQPSTLEFEILALKEKLAEIELQSSAVRQELQRVMDSADFNVTQRDTDARPLRENIGINDDVYNFRRKILQMEFDHEKSVLEQRRDFLSPRPHSRHGGHRSEHRPPTPPNWQGRPSSRPIYRQVPGGGPPPPPPHNWPGGAPRPGGPPVIVNLPFRPPGYRIPPSPPLRPLLETKPALNRVAWNDFKRTQRPREDFFAIDVLMGEPVVDPNSAERNIPARLQLLPGQAPLPERIRINSIPIIKILEKIHGDDISTQEIPVVIIRPFKALIYYETKIRDWYRRLIKKHHAESVGTENFQLEGAESAGAPFPEVAEERPYVKADSNGQASSSEEADESVSESEDEEGSSYSYFFPTLDSNITSEAALQQLQCLIDFMDTELDVKLKYLRSANCKRVTFSDIWLLFKPGDFVVGQNERQAYQVVIVTSTGHTATSPYQNYLDTTKSDSEETAIRILCVHVDFDGKLLGPVAKVFTIKRFEGERTATSLEIYPFTFAKDPNLQQKLIERGKIFLEIAAIKHMHYAGLTLETRDEVDSQVVVDFEEAFTKHRGWKPRVDQAISMRMDYKTTPCYEECCCNDIIHDDSYVEKERNDDFKDSLYPPSWTLSKMPSVAIFPRPLKECQTDENRISEVEFLVMAYRVFGFLLHSRRWAKLDLTYLKPIDIQTTEDGEKSKTPLDQLVIPDEHKRMVLSLIAQHFRDKESASFDDDQADFVRGKGKGLILLLHGAPGVGKTTTAECVAQLFRKPLFQITCGDLGTTAKEVEGTLERNFELANRWGCILLLDEADVFLAKRTTLDFVRNGLVAVFLRVLEYYAGILFLTTNRVGDFDEAFTSRIHISLEYKQLDEDQTRKVFRVNLDRIAERFKRKERKFKIDDNIPIYVTDYWRDHPRARWNGRQIRNACQTALALAEFEAQGGQHDAIVDPNAVISLDVKHFHLVAKAYLNFIEYLKSIYKIYADEKAAEDLIRASVEKVDLPNPLTMSSMFESLRSWVPKEQMQQFYNPQVNYNTPNQAVYRQFSTSNHNGARYPMPYSQHQQPTQGSSFQLPENTQIQSHSLQSVEARSNVTANNMYQIAQPTITSTPQYSNICVQPGLSTLGYATNAPGQRNLQNNDMQPEPITGGYATTTPGNHPTPTINPPYGNVHPGLASSGDTTNQGEPLW